MAEKFVKKTERLAFYGVPAGDSITYHRMKGFDKLDRSANPTEYSRSYVDEDSERSDVTGYSPEYSCSYDEIIDNDVHDDLRTILDGELIGSAAVRSIVIVDLAHESETKGSYIARERKFTVVNDSEARENFFNRSINMRANGEKVTGIATTTDEWQTLTFTPDNAE